MDFRDYDPAIARWTGIDPVTHHNMSPYMAFDGNPVFWADPSGADADSITINGPEAGALWANIVSMYDENERDDSDDESVFIIKSIFNIVDGGAESSGVGNPQSSTSTSSNLPGIHPGLVQFVGLTSTQLLQFRVIYENPKNGVVLVTPQNGIVYRTDGLFIQNFTKSQYWYKIGDGWAVQVTVSSQGSYEYLNLPWAASAIYSRVGFERNSHWTSNGPGENQNPFDNTN
jgi:hypothetical protein